jgi:hypothetical protein
MRRMIPRMQTRCRGRKRNGVQDALPTQAYRTRLCANTPYPEAQDNEGSDESEEVEQFDDATPRASQEDNASENDHAQVTWAMRRALAHVGPPPMIDSEDDNDGPRRDRCVDICEEDDEDEEIEQLPTGVIPSDDDDLDSFVRHRQHADMGSVCSRLNRLGT